MKYLVLLLAALMASACGALFIWIMVEERYLMFVPLAGFATIIFYTGKLACSFR